jgi:hypothetical protein
MALFTEDTLFNWEGRPAVILKSGKGYAVVSFDNSWKAVSAAEIVDSGSIEDPKNFLKLFPSLDPSTIPASIKPAPSKV